MGNVNNGGEAYAAFLVVERPLILNLKPSENIIAKFEVQDRVYKIDEWPSEPIAVEPPQQGLFRGTFWAVEDDDDTAQRECGEVILSRECVEKYEESAIHLVLRLMDKVPSGTPSTTQVRSIFNEEFEDAHNIQASKVCITIALVPSHLMTGRQEDLYLYQRVLTERPVMALHAKNHQVLRECHEAFRVADEDMNTLTRDFSSKEKLFQSFVKTVRTREAQMLERMKANNTNTAAKWETTMLWNDVRKIFDQWHLSIPSLQHSKENELLQKRLKERFEQLAWMSSKFFLGDLKDMPLALKVKMEGPPFIQWAQHMMRSRKLDDYIMRLFNSKAHILELMFGAWQQALSVSIIRQLTQDSITYKAGVSFRVTTVDFARASIKLHCDIEAAIKQSFLTVMSANATRPRTASTWNLGDHWQIKPIEAKHIRISLSSISSDGSGAVECSIAMPRGRTVSSVRNSLGTAAALSDDLTQRLQAVSGMQRVCSGNVANLQVCGLEIFTIREQRTEEFKGALTSVAMKALQIGFGNEGKLMVMTFLQGWREVAEKAKKEAKDEVNKSLQQHLVEAMRKEHAERTALLRSKMLRAFGDKAQDFGKQVCFQTWKDMAAAKKDKRHDKAALAEKIAFTMSEASLTAELHTLFRCWKEQAVASRLISQKEQAILLAEKRQEIQLEKALSAWGDHNTEVTMHIFVREWKGVIEEEKRIFKEAMELESHRKVKELHDRKVQGVLLQLDSTSDEFVQKIFFSVWKDYIEDGKVAVQLSEVTSQAERFRHLHSSGVGKLATQLCALDEHALIHLVFGSWRIFAREQKEQEALKAHLEATKALHVERMDKAVLVWGESNKGLALQTIFHVWSRSVYEMRVERERAESMARHAAIKEVHDTKMKYVLQKMEGENDEFLLQLLIETWRDMTEEALHATEVSGFAAEVERVKHWNQGNMQKMLTRTAGASDGVVMHIAFSGWKEMLADKKRTTQISGHLQKLKDANEKSMDKAILLWGQQHDHILLSVFVRGWSEELARIRDERKEAERLAREQEAKIQYESSVTSVIIKMGEDNDTMISTAFFRLWKDLYEEVKIEGKLGEQVQYFKKLHSGSMQSALRRTAEVDDHMTLHIVLAGWKEQIDEKKRVKHIGEHLNHLKDKQTRTMDKAMVIMGNGNQDIFLHTVLHTWKEETIACLEQAAAADRLAREQHVKDVYDHKVLGVLTKMEGENASFLQLAFFRYWKEVWEEAHLQTEAARYKKLHSRKVQGILARTADVDKETFTHVLFSTWKETLWESKQLRHITEHLENTKNEHNNSMERALAIWGSEHKAVVLHTIIYAWLKDTREVRQEQEDAITLAREQHAKDVYDQKVMGVLMKMESENKEFIQVAFFRAWHDVTLEAHDKSEKARFRKLHGAKMQTMLMRTASSDDSTFLHVLFASWKEQGFERKQLAQITVHLQEATEKSTHSMERALMCWGSENDSVILHTILHAWNEDTRNEKEYQIQQDTLARQQHYKDVYDSKVLSVLTKMQSDNEEFLKLSMFRAWKEVWEDAHLKGEASRFRKLHSDKMKSMLGRTAMVDDETTLHVVLGIWKDAYLETKHLRQITEHLRQTTDFSSHSIERVLLIWGSKEADVVLHTILYAWQEEMRSMKEYHIRQDTLAREQHYKEVYDGKVLGVLTKMQSDNEEFLRLSMFRMWKEMWEDAHVKTEASRYRKLHSEKMKGMLSRTAMVDDETTLHLVLGIWKDAYLETRHLRQITDHLDMATELSSNSMNRALMIWGKENTDVVLHSILYAWLEEMRSMKEYQIQQDTLAREMHYKEVYDGKVLGVLTKMQSDNEEFLLLSMFRMWKEVWEDAHLKTEASRYRKLHSEKMRGMLSRTAMVDDETTLHMVLANWRDAHLETRHLRQIKSHLQAASRKSEFSMQRAIMIWGEQHRDVILHSIIYAWHEDMRTAREQQIIENTHAREQHVQDIYDHRVLGVLTKMQQDNVAFIQMTIFRAWKDAYEELQLKTEAARYRKLHSAKMQSMLARTAMVDDDTILTLVLATWKEAHLEMLHLRQIQEHREFVTQNLTQKADMSLNRALMIWGDHHRDVILHSIIYAWYQDMRNMREQLIDEDTMRRQQRSKEVYDSRVTGVLVKMQSDNAEFIQMYIFRAWKEAYEEAHLKTEAARYRKLHSAKMVKIVGRTAMVDDETAVHFVLATWKEAYYEALHLRQIKEHQRILTQKSENSLNRAVMIWGDHHRDVSLHCIMYAWYQDMRNMREQLIDQDRIHREQRAKEVYERRIMSVLLKMMSDDAEFLLLSVFRMWKEVWEEAQLKGEAARYRKLHSQKMMNLVMRTAMVDAETSLGFIFSLWKEHYYEVKHLLKMTDHLREVTTKADISLQRAVVIWGDQQRELILHSIMKVWHEDILAMKELAIQEHMTARLQHAKEVYEKKVLGVLIKAMSDNTAFIQMAAFRNWKEQHEELHLTTEAARFRKMHSEHMKRMLGRTFMVDEATTLHFVWATWKEAYFEMVSIRQITAHLDEEKSKAADSQNRAVMLWANEQRDIYLHSIIYAWHEDTRTMKELQEQAHQLAREQVAKDKYDKKVGGVLMKMQSDNRAFIQLNLFRMWKEAWEDAHLKTEAARYKKLHSAQMQQYLSRTAMVDDSSTIHVVLATWKELLLEAKHIKQIAAHLDEEKEANEKSMQRALVLWGNQNKDVVLHTVLYAWLEDVNQEKAMAAEVLRIAEKKRAKESYDYKVMGVISKMQSDNSEFMKLSLWRTWYDFIEEARLEKKGIDLAKVEARVEHLRLLHKGPVRQAVFKLANVNDGLTMRSTFSCWKEYVVDQINTRRTAQRLAKLDSKSTNAIDKAMVKWDTTNNVLCLHTILHTWMQDVAEEKAIRGKDRSLKTLQRKKAEYDQKLYFILFQMAEADSGTLTAATFQAWFIVSKEGRYSSTVAQLNAALTYLLNLHAGPVHAMVERFAVTSDTTNLHIHFVHWREFVAEQRMLRHMRMHVGDTKARHSFAMEKAVIHWGGVEGDVLYRLALQAWLRTASEDKEWKMRNDLQKMTNQADRLKYLNKTGVGAVLTRVAMSATSVSLLTAYACWKNFIRDLKDERTAFALNLRIDKAHVSILQSYIMGNLRRSFLVWRQEYAWAKKLALRDTKLEMAKQVEEHGEHQKHLRGQVAGLQHQLAVQLLAAEHNVEETHSHSFHLGSCVEDLKASSDAGHTALASLEKELALFEQQLTGNKVIRAGGRRQSVM